MCKTIFQSKRLLCRRLIQEDIDALYAVYSDPVAMRFVGDGQPITQSKCVSDGQEPRLFDDLARYPALFQ